MLSSDSSLAIIVAGIDMRASSSVHLARCVDGLRALSELAMRTYMFVGDYCAFALGGACSAFAVVLRASRAQQRCQTKPSISMSELTAESLMTLRWPPVIEMGALYKLQIQDFPCW